MNPTFMLFVNLTKDNLTKIKDGTYIAMTMNQ